MAPPVQNITDRILRHSMPEPNSGCWLWLGYAYRAPIDYRPFIQINGRSTLAHRVSYEAFKGSIPSGLYVCHTCHNSMCVNPDHLYAGTPKQNTQDMMRAGRHFSQNNPSALAALKKRIVAIGHNRRLSQFCKQGHLLEGDNLMFNERFNKRRCKTCHKSQARNWYLRKKEELNVAQ